MNTIASIYWNVSPEIFNIGFLHIRWYGLLYALGFVIGYHLISKIYRAENKPQKDVEALTIMMIVAVIVGARLGHCLFYDPIGYLSDPISILKIWEGGLASHGAAVSIPIAIWLYVRKRPHITYMWLIDRIVIIVAFAGFMIRTGNLFNSEMIGTQSDLPWAVVFASYDMVPRHPAQMYEAFSYLLIGFILFFTYKKLNRNPPAGLLFGLFLILVFTARILIEFVKIDQVPFEAGMMLNMGQLLSIPFVLLGIFFLVRVWRKKANAGP